VVTAEIIALRANAVGISPGRIGPNRIGPESRGGDSLRVPPLWATARRCAGVRPRGLQAQRFGRRHRGMVAHLAGVLGRWAMFDSAKPRRWLVTGRPGPKQGGGGTGRA